MKMNALMILAAAGIALPALAHDAGSARATPTASPAASRSIRIPASR